MTCPECEQFLGRANDVCNGTALIDGVMISREMTDAWRTSMGLFPIGGQAAPVISPTSDRPKGDFAYFTGTNRGGQDNQIIATMLRSMRTAGVKEDLHVFSPQPVPGAINHKIAQGYPWKHHMAKLDFLREMGRSSQYEYVAWLDSDNYFTRDPGDLRPMIRDNPLWVAMESPINSPQAKRGDWYRMSYPWLTDLFRSEGVTSNDVWSSNGGFWIVRTTDANRVADKAYELYHRWHSKGWHDAPDEAVLACIGAMWVDDPYLNTTENSDQTWACDWVGRYSNRIPDGRQWLYEDWMSGRTWKINPAIVHAMRSKTAMAVTRNSLPHQPVFVQPKEPVGTKLKEVIEECGLKQPAGCSCNAWVNQLNSWGIEGCQKNKSAILNHLTDAAKKSGWMDMLKVAARGYLTTGSLLDEAIERANQTRSVPPT